MSSLVRVLYTSPTSQIGGAEICLLDLTRELLRDGVKVMVACPAEGPLVERLGRNGVPFQQTRLGELSRRHPARFARGVMSLVRVARSSGADILHSNGIVVSEQTYLAARLAGTKVVCHVRDLCPVLGARWLRRYALNHCDRVIAISEAVRDDLVEKIGVRRGHVTTIHDGRDLGAFVQGSPGHGDFFAGTAIEGHRRIGVVARLSPEKGQERFLKAAAAVARECPDAGFAIVGDAVLGDGRYASRLVALAGSLGLAERTVFTGFTDRMPEMMASLDVLVVPSDAEPFGLVTVEAMASGKPVVATDAGGSREVVVDGATGLLVGPQDSCALPEAILRLLRDPGLALRMGEAGRRRAAGMFTVQEHATRVRQLHDSLWATQSRWSDP